MIRFSIVLLFLCLAGSCDPDALEAGERAGREAYARGGFDPAFSPDPVECRARGRQFIAHRADAGDWTYSCVDADLWPSHAER